MTTSVTLLDELPSMTTIVFQTRGNGVTLLDYCYVFDDCYVLATQENDIIPKYLFAMFFMELFVEFTS